MTKTLLTVPASLLKAVQKASKAPTKSKAVIIAMEGYLKDKKLERLTQRIGKGFGTTKRRLHQWRNTA